MPSFKTGNPGCCCTAPGVTQCVHVVDCAGAVLSGATVTFTRSGFTTVSGTTDGSGNYCVALSNTGSWTMTITKSNYATSTESITPSGTTANRTMSSCPPATPFATTHVSITSNGLTWTLTASSTGVWKGTKRLTTLSGYTAFLGVCSSIISYVEVIVTLNCDGVSCPTVTQTFGVTFCPAPGTVCNYYSDAAGLTIPFVGSTIGSVTSSPWSLTGTWGGYLNGYDPSSTGCPTGPLSGGFTITL